MLEKQYKETISMLVKVLRDTDPQSTTADEIKDFLIDQIAVLVDLAVDDIS